MDLSSNSAPLVAASQPAPTPAPQIEPDQRPVADVAKAKSDPTPEIPMPIPSNFGQSGLVGAAVLNKVDAAPKLDSSGVSAIERTLKPYGVSMLPEKTDTTPQQNADQSKNK